MERRQLVSKSLLRSLVSATVMLAAQPAVFAEEIGRFEADRAKIASMAPDQLALSILSVRTDLKEYSKEDLSTTSGQYELLYDETMGPCGRRKDLSEPYQLCSGRSLYVNFFGYLESNQRVCPDPETGSCWKPSLTVNQMRLELFELVKKMRTTQSSQVSSPAEWEQDAEAQSW